MNEKIFVIAGNQDQFKNYRNRKIVELSASGKTITLSNFVYVSGPEVFRGWNEVHGVFVGTFRDRPDIREIVRQIRIVNKIPDFIQLIPDLYVGAGLKTHKPIQNPNVWPPKLASYVFFGGVIQPPDSFDLEVTSNEATFIFKQTPATGTIINIQYGNNTQLYAASGISNKFTIKLV